MDDQLRTELLDESIASQALAFGTFTLKSGRQSPYFFNSGCLCSGKALSVLAEAYARCILDLGVEFDVIFGPAYKGIPLAALAAARIYDLTGRSYGYAYNRKEAKTHGEGGNLVGTPMRGKRVVIIDDVLTAGTAIREAVSFLDQVDATLVGVTLLLDRQERASGSGGDGDNGASSAIGNFKKEYRVPLTAILTLDHIIAYTRDRRSSAEAQAIEDYKSVYRAIDHE